MKKISLLLGAALMVLVMASCGTQKQTASNDPCKDCVANSEVYRYLAQDLASSERQIQTARTNAANTARRQLAAMVETSVKNVIETYDSQYVTGATAEDRGRTQNISRTVVNQLVKGTPIVCEKQIPSTTTPGAVMCYVCVELSTKTVVEAVANAITQDEKLRTDYEYEKFKDVFYTEIENYNNNNK
jgi:hypothetical protein